VNENISINPLLSNLIPVLTPDEYQNLEKSIINEGCRDALILWDSTIVDGHNRYEICTKHNIEFKTIQKDFENIEYAKKWIIINHLSRRNLSNYQRSILALELEDFYRKEATNRMLSGGKIDPAYLNEGGETRDKVAKKAGVSHGTIDRVKKIKEKASDKIKEQLISGDISINQAYKAINTHVGHNSGENEWYTPSNIIELARQTMGSIDLDPASCDRANQTVKAKKIYTEQNSGLLQTWSGNVWMNPPYAQPLMAQFSEKLIQELPNINQACVLVNNATETQWLRSMMRVCNAVCFIRGRVKFIDINGKASGSPLQGQVILYFGIKVDNFCNNFSTLGICMPFQNKC
jgi:hypothetical protein